MSSPLASPAYRKYKSDAAADKALKQISTIEILEQINLFETVLQLYSIGALTRLENEKLLNNYLTELTRKSLLVTSIIPGKGCYKGMRYLRRALKKTGQSVLLDKLDKAYEDAVDVLIAELKDLHLIEMEPEVNDDTHSLSTSPTAMHFAIKRRSGSFDSIASLEQQNGGTSPQLSPSHTPELLYRDVLHRCNAIKNSNGVLPIKKISTSSATTDDASSDDDDEADGNGANVIVLDDALEQQPIEQSVGINIQMSLPLDCSGVNLPPIVIKTPDATPSPPFSLFLPFRNRSAHISHRVNPRKKFSDQAEPNAGTAFVKSQSEDYSMARPVPTASFTNTRSVSFESDQQSPPNGRLQDRLNIDNDKVSHMFLFNN